MDEDGLRKVSPWEMGLLADAAQGLTYRQIAYKRGKKVKTVERAFERLREKLRAHGGGERAGWFIGTTPTTPYGAR